MISFTGKRRRGRYWINEVRKGIKSVKKLFGQKKPKGFSIMKKNISI